MIKGMKVALTYPAQKTRKPVAVLKGVDFVIEKGRITSFIGKSGAGKTSLLKCIAHLIDFYEGSISFKGKALKTISAQERVTHVGYVFQQFNLFPHMTVLKNCMHPLQTVLVMAADKAEALAREKLALVDMSAYINAYSHQLSGGQQQRVAIARALCLNPEVLLLDEPTSALDPQSTAALCKVLLDLRDAGITIALSSHDMPFVKKILDKVYFVHEGSISDTFDRKKEQGPEKGMIYNFLHNF